jgi:predicted ATP-grasp superfamily ATP-dependent carboligase
MKQKVVIIGHGFTSRLGVIRSVAQVGCEVTVIVMTGYKRLRKTLNKSIQIDCYSKYVSQIYYCYCKDGEGLIQLLLNKCADKNQKVIIIPDSDFSAVVIDNNQERLNKHFLFPHIRHQAGAVYAWMNKTKQKSLAQELGMNVAQAVVVDIVNRQFTIPQDIHYPCFPKPVATVDGGKKYLCKCNNERELCQVLKRAKGSSNIRVLIEDYKQIEEEYAVLGFSDGRQVVIPAVIKFRQPSKSHVGVALQGEIIPTNGFEQMTDLFQEFIRRIGFCGIFDVDFYQSGAKFYFGELNLRFGASGYAVTKMGVNLPGMLVKTLLDESIEEMNHEVKSSALFVNERMCLDDWFRGYISTNEFYQLLDTADIRFVDDEEDPCPQNAFEREFKVKRMRKPFMKCYLRVRALVR